MSDWFYDSIPAVAISLDRHVGLNVATRVWRCMPRDGDVCPEKFWFCCVVSVLAAV